MKRVSSYREMWQDKHKGETCLIVANGPGLKSVPKDALEKYPSFGCNRIHFRFDEDGFAPTYYCSMGFWQTTKEEQFEQIHPMLEKVDAAFINKMWVHEFPFDNVWGIIGPVFYGPAAKEGLQPGQQMDAKTFSYNPFKWVGLGFTMTYIMFQLAYYMGFETALLIGADGTYKPKGKETKMKHFYSDDKTEGMWETAPGPHEHKDWQKGCEQVYGMAFHAYMMGGRKIINISDPTEVRMFPKGDWHEWLQ